MKQLKIILGIVAMVCLACGSEKSIPMRSVRPTLAEGMHEASSSLIEDIYVEHKFRDKTIEFSVLGEAFCRPLFSKLHESFQTNRDEWTKLPKVTDRHEWRIIVHYKGKQLYRNDAKIVTKFAILLPEDTSKIITESCRYQLLATESKALKDPDHIYGD